MKKSAIITGGSRGIGLAIAQKLAKDGFDAAIFDIRPAEDVKDAIDGLSSLGSQTLYFQGDISSTNDTKTFAEAVAVKYGRLDVLINNAGVAPKVRADMLETTEESFDFVTNVNLRGNFFMTQAAANAMIKFNNGGTIINISSVSAFAVSLNRPEYCVSKAGVSMLTKLFAARLAEHGINVYELRPGVIKTDMTAGVSEKYDKLIEDGVFPIKRWGYPEDIAKAASALCGGCFSYSTGEAFNIDGGFHIQAL